MIHDEGKGFNRLHLKSLHVKGFGGIRDLAIPDLGRVTLFSGKNGAGKTTLLEAVRVYAARGEYNVLVDMLRKREELVETEDQDGDKVLAPNWEAIFYGKGVGQDFEASIGPIEGSEEDGKDLIISEDLKISLVNIPDDADMEDFQPLQRMHTLALQRMDTLGEEVNYIRLKYGGKSHYVPIYEIPMLSPSWTRRRRMSKSPLRQINCKWMGPGLPRNEDLAVFWDEIALTEEGSIVLETLNIILENKATGLAMVGGDDMRRHGFNHGRRPIVRIDSQNKPVPLRTLGDGAVRLLGIALSLAYCKNGFLLIDEAENGIHHSIQHDFWKIVLEMSERNNVQVFATTHGWDCVVGFATALRDIESSSVHGALVRIERTEDEVHAVHYSDDELSSAVEYGIEMR